MGDEFPPLVPGISFFFQECRKLVVYNAPMPDSQNKNSIRKNSIDDSPVPDAICIQSFKLTCQCFAGFWIFCNSGLDLMDYPFCNRSVNILQVIQDLSLIHI